MLLNDNISNYNLGRLYYHTLNKQQASRFYLHIICIIHILNPKDVALAVLPLVDMPVPIRHHYGKKSAKFLYTTFTRKIFGSTNDLDVPDRLLTMYFKKNTCRVGGQWS